MNVGYVGVRAPDVLPFHRLMQAHRLHVHSDALEALAGLEKEGAIAVHSLRALFDQCEVVVLCARSPDHAREMLFGNDGKGAGLTPGKTVVDLTPGNPTETRRIAADLLTLRLSMVDAALHSESSLDDTEAAIFCGGPANAFDKARPVLEAICPTVMHCGDSGSGHTMKLVTIAVAACNRLITYECAAMGFKNGLALGHMSNVINTSSGSSWASEHVLPLLASGGPTANLRLDDATRDLLLASRAGMDCGAPMTIANLVRTIYEAGVNELGAACSLDDLARVYARMAEIEFAGG